MGSDTADAGRRGGGRDKTMRLIRTNTVINIPNSKQVISWGAVGRVVGTIVPGFAVSVNFGAGIGTWDISEADIVDIDKYDFNRLVCSNEGQSES